MELSKLLMLQGGPQSRTGVGAPTAEGLGEPGSVKLDPVNDAVSQLAIVQAYFAVVTAGGTPTASQLAAAVSAIGALGADLRTLQAQPESALGKIWVSGTAAAAMAGAAGVLGGVAGWLARGSSGSGRSSR
jgi:hypothetical protein